MNGHTMVITRGFGEATLAHNDFVYCLGMGEGVLKQYFRLAIVDYKDNCHRTFFRRVRYVKVG